MQLLHFLFSSPQPSKSCGYVDTNHAQNTLRFMGISPAIRCKITTESMMKSLVNCNSGSMLIFSPASRSAFLKKL